MECVYSSEEQVTEMLPLSKEKKKNPEEFGVVDNFRYVCVRFCSGGVGVNLTFAQPVRSLFVICVFGFGWYESRVRQGSGGTPHQHNSVGSSVEALVVLLSGAVYRWPSSVPVSSRFVRRFSVLTLFFFRSDDHVTRVGGGVICRRRSLHCWDRDLNGWARRLRARVRV